MTDIEERVAKIERWIEKFESNVQKLKDDMESNWRKYEEDKINKITNNVKLHTRLGLIDSDFRHHFTAVEGRLSGIEGRLTAVEKRLSNMIDLLTGIATRVGVVE